MSVESSEHEVSGFYIAASTSLAERWTLKHGDLFALFDPYGEVVADGPGGVYYRDMRFLTRSALRIDGERPLLLSSAVQSNEIVLAVDLTNPDLLRDGRLVLAKDTIHVARAIFLWNAACHELLALRSFHEEPLSVRLALSFDADFADLFEVRGFRRTSRRGRVLRSVPDPRSLRFEYASADGVARATEIVFDPAPAHLAPGRAEYELALAPKARASVCVGIHCLEGEAPGAAKGSFFTALRRARRAARSPRDAVIETSSDRVNEVLRRSVADTAMLVTNTAQGPYPYAGIPWFSTLFGRDGLITAIELLWFAPAVARGVLEVLAAHQAQGFDPQAAAEPGKIVHELRQGELARLREIPFGRYYGSVDATPLFVVLAGLYCQRTGDRATLERLWPNIKAALLWMERHGDCDGDGFVEYGSGGEHGGLVNQGWKDSDDAVFHADGSIAHGPIALAEVQGYAYLAWLVAAQLAEHLGEPSLAAPLSERARTLQDRFESQFWCEDLGVYALALDGEKRPCRVRTSNAGQVLFSGIASPERARSVANALFSRSFFNGWGIRTVHAAEARFNPASYHNGSVWPHDSALIALGLAQYGEQDRVVQLSTALFDAALAMDLRRLPELFCGFPRRRAKGPTAYPVACSPQAWAAAAPLALLQACLNFSFDLDARLVRLRHPRLPAFLDWIRVRNLAVGDAQVDLLLRRHDTGVAVNVLERRGAVEVAVML
jgi:glycogen debranching enzyme